ncbi:type III-B CRISPR module RAMP protein Cmr4 [Vallitalea sediminicola]
MYKITKVKYIRALTPIHAGAGQGLDSVDMPIQREKHSNFPIIEASSLKGSIKHGLYNKLIHKDKKNIDELYSIFGPEEGDNYASAIGFTDAKLLFFPIKSMTNIYKLVTCPYILKRWIEDIKFQSESNENNDGLEKYLNDLNILEGKCISNNSNPEVLEEYIFEQQAIKELKQNKLKPLENYLDNHISEIDKNRLVILNNTDFTDLVTMYTEVITRNAIDINTGAAKESGLFTEEYLPSEAILYFTVLASDQFTTDITAKYVMKYFDDKIDGLFQIGGNATLGKGFTKLIGKECIKGGEKIGK